jgi:hypothetical protein
MDSMTVTRRKLISGVSALALGGTIRPIALLAQGWEEVGLVLSICSSIVGIVSGISGMIANNQILDTLQDIEQKLDQVISLEVEILNAIATLKLYIDQAILNGWAQSYGRDIDAYGTEFNALAVAPNQKDQKIQSRWQALGQVAPETTVRLGDVEFGIFPFFCHGVAITLVTFRLINFPISSQRQYYGRYAGQIDKWLDPNNPRSIPNSISSLGNQIATRRKALDNSPKKVLINTVSEQDSHCFRHHDTYVNIAGTFDTGYTGTQSTEVGPWQCLDPPPHHGPNPAFGTAERAIAKSLGAQLEVADDVPTVPVFTPSGYAVVDARNQERIAIFQLMATQAIEQGMSEQMDLLRKTLRSI